MVDFFRLPLRAADGLAHVVVETPRGARVKVAYNPQLSCFAMSRALPIGLAYPYDWGFLPSTLGEDGDPLDALVIRLPGLSSTAASPERSESHRKAPKALSVTTGL